MIDLDRATLTEIKRILNQHVPVCRVWAFGSRADKHKHHPNADLDLALEYPENQIPDWEQIEHLRQAFSESDIPILVDISLWEDLPPALQQHIRSHGEEISLVNHSREAGFTIVQAIFVLVVLGMLGAYMVTMSTVQQATSTQALMQARAYQAARAGLEWGTKTVVDSDPSECFTSSDGDFSLGVFDVDVDCEKLDEGHEANQPFKVFNLKSTATYNDISSPDYVSRTLEVTIHD